MNDQVSSFKSKRLSFRFLTVNDVSNKYIKWLNDPQVNQYLEFNGTPFNLDNLYKFVKCAEEDPNIFLFGIFDIDSDLHIGNIKFHYESVRHKRGSIGLLIGEKQYWGKGLATEAIRRIAEYSFEFTDVEKIYAGASSSNHASIKAFQNAGFSLDGVSRLHGVNNGKREDKIQVCVFKSSW